MPAKTEDYLPFSDFKLTQGAELYHFNSDTVALGLFLDTMAGKEVLDIGTGCGALLLYASLKKAKAFYGIDCDREALIYAQKNLARYLKDFTLFTGDVRDFRQGPFDIIVTNPPFFNYEQLPKKTYLHQAMSAAYLPLNDLFRAFKRLLKDNGTVYLIYPAEKLPALFQNALSYTFKFRCLQFVYDTKKETAKRVLVQLKRGKMTEVKVLKPLFIREGKIILDREKP